MSFELIYRLLSILMVIRHRKMSASAPLHAVSELGIEQGVLYVAKSVPYSGIGEWENF